MEIIDKQGRLFGIVNVVDALVVLLVLAVGLAGVALIVGGGGGGPTGPTETQYVTLDVGVQPDYVVEAVESGDNATLDGAYENANVTDTYFASAGNGTNTVIRLGITHGANSTPTVDGEPLRIGRRLGVENPTYVLNGTIRDVGSGPELPTADRQVVLRGTVTDAVTDEISAGDEIRVAGNRIATIQDMMAFDAERPGQRTVYVDASVRTYTMGETDRFGETRIETGKVLTLPLAGTQFSSSIERVGGGLNRTTESVLATGVVDADTARRIETGDTYEVAGRAVATVSDVIAYDTNERDRKRVHVGLSIEALGYGERNKFGSQPIEKGATIPFRTDHYEFSSEVRRVGTADLQVTTEDVLVTDVVDTAVAREMTEGDTYRVSDRTLATLENVAIYGTANPDRKRVYVGLTVRALGYGERPQFGTNRSLERGVTLPFRTVAYEFDGQIVQPGTLAQPGQATTRTVTLEMTNIAPSRADSVTAGLGETNAGQTIAEINDVAVQPAVITLTSDDGNIYERKHPVNKDVTLTAALQVREDDRAVRFKGRTVQEGDRITLDLGVTTVEATIVDLDAE